MVRVALRIDRLLFRSPVRHLSIRHFSVVTRAATPSGVNNGDGGNQCGLVLTTASNRIYTLVAPTEEERDQWAEVGTIRIQTHAQTHTPSTPTPLLNLFLA